MGALSDRGIVTPEAVRLEFQTGGVGSRGIAFVLDALIYVTVLVLIMIAVAILGDPVGALPAWLAISILIVTAFLVLMGYPIAFETLRGGRTPGKAALGLRVVTQEGGPVGFRHAFIRAALGLLELWGFSGAPAIVSALLTAQNQRLGDLAAGTLVVRERGGRTPPRTATFAPLEGLESYTRTLDVSALRHHEYAPVRAFLIRARGLQPARRRAIAERLAEQIAARVRPPAAPRALSAEEFLWCVASAYQARHATADPVGAQGTTDLAAVPLPPQPKTTPSEEPSEEQGDRAPSGPPPGAGGETATPERRSAETASSGEATRQPPSAGGFVPPA